MDDSDDSDDTSSDDDSDDSDDLPPALANVTKSVPHSKLKSSAQTAPQSFMASLPQSLASMMPHAQSTPTHAPSGQKKEKKRKTKEDEAAVAAMIGPTGDKKVSRMSIPLVVHTDGF